MSRGSFAPVGALWSEIEAPQVPMRLARSHIPSASLASHAIEQLRRDQRTRLCGCVRKPTPICGAWRRNGVGRLGCARLIFD